MNRQLFAIVAIAASAISAHAQAAPEFPGKPITTFLEPSFQKWEKAVANLPAEKQVEAVTKKLQELNPGFDGDLHHSIEGGAVTELSLYTFNVADISPIRALPKLMILKCRGTPDSIKGKLSDLSPLQGAKLITLWCYSNPITDLSALKGMPLIELDCHCTTIADLSPLCGMPLVALRCYDTQVSDLSPLKGMPLTFLACGTSKASDLSPLESCESLTVLHVRQSKVAAAGVDALRKALPNCNIEWDDPAKAAVK